MAGAPRTVNFTDVTQSLLEVEGVKEVHDLRMWSLSMNKIAIAVHLAVGLYIVLDLFTFFPLHPLMSSCMSNFCYIEHYFSSVLMIMLSFLPLCVIYLCTYPHEIRRQMLAFSLYIYREGQRSNGCAEDKYPHSPKEVRYIGERDSD